MTTLMVKIALTSVLAMIISGFVMAADNGTSIASGIAVLVSMVAGAVLIGLLFALIWMA